MRVDTQRAVALLRKCGPGLKFKSRDHRHASTTWSLRAVDKISIAQDNLPPVFDQYSMWYIIANELGDPEFKLQSLCSMFMSNEKCYTEFYIDKDTGETLREPDASRRLRKIKAPYTKLKKVQKVLADMMFSKLPIHEANCAYVPNKNVLTACQIQAPHELTIAVDLKEFFESHTQFYIKERLKQLTGYTDWTSAIIAKLCTCGKVMPQGSVASPILSLVLNYEIDTKIAELASSHGLVYTRYADDLHFSGNDRTNRECFTFIKQLQEAIKPFRFNYAKTRIMRNTSSKYVKGWSIRGSDVNFAAIRERISRDHPHNLRVTNQLDNGSVIGLTIKIHDMEQVLCRDISSFDPLLWYMRDIGATVQELYWYEGKVRRLFGLNLLDGRVSYPRSKYLKLRNDVMLVGLGVHTTPYKVMGMLGYVKMVDPVKHRKLVAILNSYKSVASDRSKNSEKIKEEDLIV